MATQSLPEAARDNRANQLNPTHPAYYRSRGASAQEAESLATHAQPVRDNRAKQLVRADDAFMSSRRTSRRLGSSSDASSAESE